MFEDNVQNYTDALYMIQRLRDETCSAVFPVRQILLHAESYIQNQFKEYFKAD